MSSFEERKKRQQQMIEIKKKMDERVSKIQKEKVYEMFAKEDEELAELLKIYNQF